jgi:hypothetical protein
MRYLTALLLLTTPLAISACQTETEPPARSPDTPAAERPATPAPGNGSDDPPAGPFEGTVDETAHDVDTSTSVTLVGVRTAEHDGFDRVTFEFEGDDLPGYRIAYVDEVTECGSGHTVPLAGEAAMYVSFAPAAAHTSDAEGLREATIDDTDRQPGLESVRQLTMSCDHHGGVGWGVGTADELPYRVETLDAPARLALDIRHR